MEKMGKVLECLDKTTKGKQVWEAKRMNFKALVKQLNKVPKRGKRKGDYRPQEEK